MNRKTEAFKKENLMILLILLIVFLVISGAYLFFFSGFDKGDVKNSNIVTRVIDGDTFELSSGETVRLLCVDTPEKNQAGYLEAKEFLSSLILNKEVRLEKENSETDNYGRLLRYVYVNQSEASCSVGDEKIKDPNILSSQVCFSVGDGELFVNNAILSNGYGSLFVYGDDLCKKMN